LAKSPAIIQLNLRPVFRAALRRWADETGVTEAEAAARLVEQGLEQHLDPSPDVDQARAERRLLDLAARLAREEVANAPEWNEKLTLAVFERIRHEHRALYDEAIEGGQRDAVNPRVARQIKTAVGARVKMRGKRPATSKAPRRSGALISDYTLLLEPE
jgi:hypothetical protein